MKKQIFFTFLCSLVLGISACNVSYGGDGGSVVANLTALSAPINVRVETDKFVHWDEVPNASSYVVKINGHQENSGNALKYSIGSIIDSYVEYNVETDLTITVKAKGNQILYADSGWSNPINYKYTKIKSDVPPGEREMISLPANIHFDESDRKMKWDAVSGARGYQVQIEGRDEDEQNSSEYPISGFENNESFRFRIKTLASEASSFKDSDWSSYGTYIYKLPKQVTQYTWSDEIITNGIGRTVNAIEDPYIQISSKGDASNIFKKNELFKIPLFKESVAKQTANFSSGESIYEYYDSFSKKHEFAFSNATSLSAKVDGVFNAGVSATFEICNNTKISKERTDKTKELYFTYSQVYSGEKIYIDGYGNISKLSKILSDSFLNDAKTMTPQSFFYTYGTHLLAGGIFGGRMDLIYSLVSDSTEINEQELQQFSTSLKKSAEITIADEGESVGTSDEREATLKDTTEKIKKWKENATASQFNISAVGGTKVLSVTSFDDLSSQIQSWANTIRDNMVLIDALSGSLISLWELLPNTEEYETVRQDLYEYFVSNCNEEYSEMLNLFSKSTIKGTDTNPYLISNGQELYSEILNHDAKDVHFRLTNNIDLSGTAWTPIHEFKGVLNGAGFSIVNLNVPASTARMGQYVYLDLINNNYGIIKNIHFEKPYLFGEQRENKDTKRYIVSGIVGVNQKDAKIYNVSVDEGYISATVGLKTDKAGINGNLLAYVGMIAGLNCGEIQYCVSSGCELKGYTDTKFNTCDNYTLVGGVVGRNQDNGKLIDCASNNNNLYSYSTGGYYHLFQGSGSLRCWNGYIAGSNVAQMIRCVSGVHASGSNVVDVNDFAEFTGVFEYPGLISGKQEGNYTNVLCVKVDSLKVNGNNSNDSECKKDSLSDVWAAVQLWQHWCLLNEKLYFDL